jgi:hypothetical protein
MAITATLVSCDVKRKDKIGDDSKLDSLKTIETRYNDSVKLVKEQQVRDEATKNSTTVQLIDSVFDFGSIVQDEKVEYNYRFKNTGTNPLVIFNAVASCGCTVPEKPEKPVMPGETGFIKVVFNSAGKNGHQSKDITVNANTAPAFPVLKLTGEIKAKL